MHTPWSTVQSSRLDPAQPVMVKLQYIYHKLLLSKYVRTNSVHHQFTNNTNMMFMQNIT